MGVLASAGGWLLSFVLKKSTTDFLRDTLARLLQSDEGSAKLEEIRSGAEAALSAEETKRMGMVVEARRERQAAKMNWPVFWVIIVVMLGAPALLLWSVTLYNILFWEHGIWPQGWAIAAYPPSIAPWVEQSIDWLYDPVGAPSTVGAALVAGKITARR